MSGEVTWETYTHKQSQRPTQHSSALNVSCRRTKLWHLWKHAGLCWFKTYMEARIFRLSWSTLARVRTGISDRRTADLFPSPQRIRAHSPPTSKLSRLFSPNDPNALGSFRGCTALPPVARFVSESATGHPTWPYGTTGTRRNAPCSERCWYVRNSEERSKHQPGYGHLPWSPGT